MVRAKEIRTKRVRFSDQVFGLRICHPTEIIISWSCLASAFTGNEFPIGCAPAGARWRSGLMRYRSATVAGFHGLP